MQIQASEYPYTIDRFYEHAREAVMYFNGAGNVNINTYAVVDNAVDFDSATLGYDTETAQSRYFFSRAWENIKTTEAIPINYPVLIISPNEHRAFDLLKATNRSQKIKYNFTFYLLDTITEQKEDTLNGTTRTKYDIYRDTGMALIKFVHYYRQISFAKVTQNNDAIVYGYYHPLKLAAMIAANEIKSYTYDADELRGVQNWYKIMIEKNSEAALGDYREQNEKKLCGIYTTFSIETWICMNPDFDFDFDFNAHTLKYGK